MNVFEEFKRLVSELDQQDVRYALVGGVATLGYTEPRFIRDIDILVDSEDLDKIKNKRRDRPNIVHDQNSHPWKLQSSRRSLSKTNFLC